jgi:ribosomal protein S18 acetylase RimI-like enzyme
MEDAAALGKLYDGSLRYMAQLQPRQYRAVEQDKAFVQAGILEEDAQVFVAEEAGQLIGLASVFTEETKPLPMRVQQRYCVLDTIYVAEEYRNRGVGSCLFQAAWDWTKSQGLSNMQLMTLGQNQKAQRFYERLGMEKLKIVYILENQ